MIDVIPLISLALALFVAFCGFMAVRARARRSTPTTSSPYIGGYPVEAVYAGVIRDLWHPQRAGHTEHDLIAQISSISQTVASLPEAERHLAIARLLLVRTLRERREERETHAEVVEVNIR